MAARNLPGLMSSKGKPLARILQSGPRWTGEVEINEKALFLPLRWWKGRRIFVNSMSDLFHESLADEVIDRVFAVMALCPQHTFQILTKRAERMRAWFTENRWERVRVKNAGRLQPEWSWPLPNVWLGCSVENQATADARIPLLLKTPAAVRFVSYEPGLGPVDFKRYLAPNPYENVRGGVSFSGLRGNHPELMTKLDLLICGGESGPGARPFNLRWAYSALKQCKEAHVACFIKQLGAKPGTPSCADFDCTHPDCGTTWLKLKDRKGGDWSDPNFPEALKVREMPA